MKIELGGGGRPRGDGFLNVDLVPGADIKHDLDVRPYPFDDDTITEVYSSHCLEHLDDPHSVLVELCRICVPGALVEIRVPHPSSDLAMVWTHKHVFSPVCAINMDEHFPDDFWPKTNPKRMKLLRLGYGPTFLLAEARRELPFLAGLSDETVMKYVPRTCHEVMFYYQVQSHG